MTSERVERVLDDDPAVWKLAVEEVVADAWTAPERPPPPEPAKQLALDVVVPVRVKLKDGRFGSQLTL